MSFANTRLTSNTRSNQQPPILGTKNSVNLLLTFANQKHANMMCLVNITTTTFTFTYLMNVNCVIGQATPILTHSSTNVMCFGVKKLRPPKREQNARPHLLFTSTQLEGWCKRLLFCLYWLRSSFKIWKSICFKTKIFQRYIIVCTYLQCTKNSI